MGVQNSKYIISDEESKRIQILKIWFTIMVIFIHSYTDEVPFTGSNITFQVPIWLDWVKYIISEVISRCSIPGYFFISAVLLYKKEFSWATNIKKKLKTLLVPYLIFNTLWILIFYMAQCVPFFAPYFMQEANIIANWDVVDYANAYLGFRNGFPYLTPLWFIRDLFMLNLFAIFAKRFIDKFPRIIFAFLLIMIILNIQTPFFFLSQSALVYFCLGYYFVKYSIRFNDMKKIKASYIITVYLATIILDCLTRNMVIHYLPHFITIVFGLIFFYRFTTKIPGEKSHKILLYIAKYSFPIYLFHERSLSILKKILTILLPQTVLWQTVLYFGIPIVIFFLCLLLSYILDNYFHKIYMVLVGSRSK